MSNILFIGGTDTGVGKTTVASLLAAELVRGGYAPSVLKPVETGCVEIHGKLFAEDAAKLAAAANLQEADCCLYRFRTPVAPAVAAQVEKSEIDPEVIRKAIIDRSHASPIVIVEGAGGLLVPFAPNVTFADLIAKCGGICLLVVGSRLGAINHAALSFEALRSRRIPLLGYVLNELHTGKDFASCGSYQTNREAIARTAESYEAFELAYLPPLSGGAEAAAIAVQPLISRVIEHFNLSR